MVMLWVLKLGIKRLSLLRQLVAPLVSPKSANDLLDELKKLKRLVGCRMADTNEITINQWLTERSTFW